MNKKLMAILMIGALILVAGCTNDDTPVQVSGEGKLNFSYQLSQNQVSTNDLSYMTIRLENNYNNTLENIDVSFETKYSGITSTIDGPTSLDSEELGIWDVEIDIGQVIHKSYDFVPVICFDYTQSKRASFRASSTEPSSSTVEYPIIESGPLTITFTGIKSINDEADQGIIDLTVSYAFSNSLIGLTNKSNLEDMTFTYGAFSLDSFSEEYLKLKASQSSNKLKDLDSSKYCTHFNSGLSTCFVNSTGIPLNTEFGFRIETNNLDSEIESYFENEISYRVCVKSSSLISIDVVSD
jgi:hypothetical protein